MSSGSKSPKRVYLETIQTEVGAQMPSLPPLDVTTNTNHAPHVVILGAGASLAALPGGDASGRELPLMRNVVEVVGLEPLLRMHGIAGGFEDFELLYDKLATDLTRLALLGEIESRVRGYFAGMQLPKEVTLYDLVLLSLREKDVVATFNWDPFLAQAYRRNIAIRCLPSILFLHGNVEVGVCQQHRRKGFIHQCCSECGRQFEPSRLLFPVGQKDYTNDPFIKNEWDQLQDHLERAYIVTIFGYSAPVTDIEARSLLLKSWRENATQELAEVEVVDIRRREELEANWADFFVRRRYAIFPDICRSLSFQYVRRSCDAFAMANLQQAPWRENPFPKSPELSVIHNWLAPLLQEEEEGRLSGTPCPAK